MWNQLFLILWIPVAYGVVLAIAWAGQWISRP